MGIEKELGMEALMFICLNCGDANCPPEVGKFAHAEAKRQAWEKTKVWPSHNELKKLDEICRKCQKGFFSIEKRECPVCGSSQVESGFIKEFSYGPVKPSHTIYPYKCAACGKSLFSYREL